MEDFQQLYQTSYYKNNNKENQGIGYLVSYTLRNFVDSEPDGEESSGSIGVSEYSS